MWIRKEIKMSDTEVLDGIRKLLLEKFDNAPFDVSSDQELLEYLADTLDGVETLLEKRK